MAEEQTRGVFAIIFRDRKILVSKRADGKGWNLPGGGVEQGEDDATALKREVEEETGLKIRIGPQIGPDHVFGTDTAVAYMCVADEGEPRPTEEAVEHRFVDVEELKELKIVGPEGRLGRTGRMMFDGLSIMQPGEKTGMPSRDMEGFSLSHDKTFIIRDTKEGEKRYPRIDPYTESGFMESEDQ